MLVEGNCLNIGISRLPHDAKYIATFDADIHFRKPGWAAEAIHVLQLYPVAQPFEPGGMGSGDHHMALGTAGLADYSLPAETGSACRDAVKLCEARALVPINRKVGYVLGTIEHRWHGDKAPRAYVSRWDMFTKHRFNTHSGLKRNSYGVPEFAGSAPDLERMFDNYLRDREEDSNIIG